MNRATNTPIHSIPGHLPSINKGPSGAGKSTLLDVLARRKTGGKITGTILVNGKPIDTDTFPHLIGYVEQQNLHILSVSGKRDILHALQRKQRKDEILTQTVIFHHHSQWKKPWSSVRCWDCLKSSRRNKSWSTLNGFWSPWSWTSFRTRKTTTTIDTFIICC